MCAPLVGPRGARVARGPDSCPAGPAWAARGRLARRRCGSGRWPCPRFRVPCGPLPPLSPTPVGGDRWTAGSRWQLAPDILLVVGLPPVVDPRVGWGRLGVAAVWACGVARARRASGACGVLQRAAGPTDPPNVSARKSARRGGRLSRDLGQDGRRSTSHGPSHATLRSHRLRSVQPRVALTGCAVAVITTSTEYVPSGKVKFGMTGREYSRRLEPALLLC